MSSSRQVTGAFRYFGASRRAATCFGGAETRVVWESAVNIIEAIGERRDGGRNEEWTVRHVEGKERPWLASTGCAGLLISG